MKRLLAATVLCLVLADANADGVDALREFVRDAKFGSAQFTQTSTSADGARKKSSSGSFEFARPDRFRFSYSQPFEQLIVSDGKKVWLFDKDLNQASARAVGAVLGATPAALLAGSAIERDFDLAELPPADGLEWVKATPKVRDGAVASLSVGFKGKALAEVVLLDAFGQRSVLRFSSLVLNTPIAAERFRFVPPPGVDVLEQ